MTPPIIEDLHKIAVPGVRNAYLMAPVIRKIAALYSRASKAEIEAELRQHCKVTDSPSGPVLRGWCLRRGQAV